MSDVRCGAERSNGCDQRPVVELTRRGLGYVAPFVCYEHMRWATGASPYVFQWLSSPPVRIPRNMRSSIKRWLTTIVS